MPEWSKGHDSSSCGFGRVGSNPTRSTFFSLPASIVASFFASSGDLPARGMFKAWDSRALSFLTRGMCVGRGMLVMVWDVRGAWDVRDAWDVRGDARVGFPTRGMCATRRIPAACDSRWWDSLGAWDVR